MCWGIADDRLLIVHDHLSCGRTLSPMQISRKNPLYGAGSFDMGRNLAQFLRRSEMKPLPAPPKRQLSNITSGMRRTRALLTMAASSSASARIIVAVFAQVPNQKAPRQPPAPGRWRTARDGSAIALPAVQAGAAANRYQRRPPSAAGLVSAQPTAGSNGHRPRSSAASQQVRKRWSPRSGCRTAR